MLKRRFKQSFIDWCDNQVRETLIIVIFSSNLLPNSYYSFWLLFMNFLVFTIVCSINSEWLSLLTLVWYDLIWRTILFIRNYSLHAKKLLLQFSNRALSSSIGPVRICFIVKGFLFVWCLKGCFKKHTAGILFCQRPWCWDFICLVKRICWYFRPKKWIICVLSCCIQLSLLVRKLEKRTFNHTIFLILSGYVYWAFLIAFLIGSKIWCDILIVDGLPFRIVDVHPFRFLHFFKSFLIRQWG